MATETLDAPEVTDLKTLPLPRPHDWAHAFYGVQLKGQKGPRFAFLIEGYETRLVDPKFPFEPFPRWATNPADVHQMEHPRSKYVCDAEGRPVTVTTRVWQHANPYYKDTRWAEDPRVAAVLGTDPVVTKIVLWCPLREPGALGAMEDHGAYEGASGDAATGEDESTGIPSGACPKCWADTKTRHVKLAQARKAIFDLYMQSGIEVPETLASRVAIEQVK